MRCADVNVLVYAHRREAPDHERYLAWLEDARRADEPLGVSSLVLSGFVRVVTHPRVFRSPTSLAEALAFAAGVRAAPNAVDVTPGPRHWDIFTGLCERAEARGNIVPDAYLAALAIESGATFYSADRGFSRFPTLRWRHPLDAS
jgi:toxin-antitoxin system PIN domain toxin